MQFESDRYFQIWDYHVSHARILIRSASSVDSSKNIDIIFYSVDYIGIPSSFEGLTLTTVPRNEADRAGAPADEFGRSNAFRFDSEGRSYYIVAHACQIYENQLELFDSSLQEPWEVQPRENRGRLLARS